MAHGGARNRSGPQADPNSLRSAKAGVVLRSLEPFTGEAPTFPLGASAMGDLIAAREVAVWDEAWTSPQASAWIDEPWRWPIIAEYCRLKAVIELTPGTTAALVGQIHRYRDQIGLTPAGLKENGWKIADQTPGELASVTVLHPDADDDDDVFAN